jgi:cytochrome c553
MEALRHPQLSAMRLPRLSRLVALAAFLIATPAAADIEQGKKIAAGRCFLCHGMSGESSSEVFPRLATQNANYLAKQLRDFQSGKRKGTTMNEMAKGLTEAEIAGLGAFYATQTADPHAPADADLAAVGRYLYVRGNTFSGVAPCATCHGAKAEGSESLPRLAGQQALYLETQLRQFNKRERTNDNAIMLTIASKLTELEIKALADYLASVP